MCHLPSGKKKDYLLIVAMDFCDAKPYSEIFSLLFSKYF